MIRTGYFANEKTFTNGHLVNDLNEPLCNCKIKNKTFQWNANGIVYEYLTCEKCKAIAIKLLNK